MGLLLLAAFASAAAALPPPRPGIVDPLTGRFRTTGQRIPLFPKEVLAPRPSPQGGRYPLAPAGARGPRGAARPLAVDTLRDSVVRPLVLLIQFRDRDFAVNATAARVEGLFFDESAGAPSVWNYWNEVSYGRFRVRRPSEVSANPDVVGWLRAGVDFTWTPATGPDNSVSIAGVQVANVRALLDNAIAHVASDPGFSFAPYVRSPDNIVQSVIIVHPGYGAEDSGDAAADPYSHSAAVAPITVRLAGGGTATIADYTIVPSIQYYSDPTKGTFPADDPLVGAGVIVHEMGHMFGLPDLYPTSTQGQAVKIFSGVGVYDLMGYGLWGRPYDASVPNPAPEPLAGNPAHLSAWSKTELGWMKPTVLSATWLRPPTPPGGPTLLLAESAPQAYKIHPNGPGDESQFFLLEFRGKDNDNTFDKGLPGNGILIWRVDNAKFDAWRNPAIPPLDRPGTLNNDPDFLALSVQEAHLDNTASGSVPDLVQALSIGARALGDAGDFFGLAAQSFSRTSPVDGLNRTNSRPVVNKATVRHLFDVGFFLTIRNFVLDFVGAAVNAAFDLVVELPYWKVFQTANSPIRSDQVVSFGFDDANRTWIGTADQGAFIFSLAAWKQLNAFRSRRVQAMAFESRTGAMWVGTDNSLEKVRLDTVSAAFPDPGQFPGFPSVNVKGLAVDRQSHKWVGGGNVLAVIFDPGNNQPSDFTPSTYADMSSKLRGFEAGEAITCLAVDNVGAGTGDSDILYIGTSRGRIFRNADPAGTTVRSLYVPGFRDLLLFEPMNGFPSNVANPVNAMTVDKVGMLWVATAKGLFALDRRDPAAGIFDDQLNPFDLNNTSDNAAMRSLVYFPFDAPAGSAVQPLGIALEDTLQPRNVVWIAYGDMTSTSDTMPDTITPRGWAERIDPNVLVNPAIEKIPVLDPRDSQRLRHATARFTRTTPLSANGPAANNLIAAAGNASEKVWFGTHNSGAVRFGAGASIAFDKEKYINASAQAQVFVVDEDLLGDAVDVTITSTLDGTGFTVPLARGSDNVFRGSFGFTTAHTDNAAHLILVAKDAAVFGEYVRSRRPARATWSSEFPFHDSLLIGGFSCFVATAAYGSPAAPEVNVLRRFRDSFLLTNRAGRLAAYLYYRTSPPVAAVIAKSPALRFLARSALVPAFLVAGLSVGAGLAEKLAIGALLCMAAGMLLLPGRRPKAEDGR